MLLLPFVSESGRHLVVRTAFLLVFFFFCRELLAGTELVQQERMKQAMRMRDDELLKAQPHSAGSPVDERRPTSSSLSRHNADDDL